MQLLFMNVSVAYKMYLHTHYENHSNVEWLQIGTVNVKFKVANATHVIPIHSIVSFTVTQ